MSATTGALVEHLEVMTGAYHDSVTLMQVSRSASAVAGVDAALVGMGTELNLDLLAGMGFAVPDGTGPNDLVVAVRAVDDGALQAALAAAQAALAGPGPASSAAGVPALVPRTTGTAARAAAARGTPATLALISVPGPHAFTEAMDALDAGLHVMVFSDNVPLEQEVALKEAAARRGLLVMGPDCGTAVVGGVGLGFANVVRPGPVGLVAASGTGAQQVMCLLDGAGIGVRHCLGVGGRDLSAAVAGRSTRQALALLDADPDVELIVVVSKPPAPDVAREVEAMAAKLSTPVQLALLGPCQPDLTVAAATAAGTLGVPWRPPRSWPGPPSADAGYGSLRGAFSGGTLCDEAMLVASRSLGPLASNIPLPGAPRLDLAQITGALPGRERPPPAAGRPGIGHAMVDFGDDELTRGRPHPMIDNSLRAEWMLAQAAQPDVGVLLLDVVLGHGAHPDPAADLAEAIGRAREVSAASGHEVAVVVSLCGTEADPQGLSRQAERLVAAGASVHLSNADAARAAVQLLIPAG